MCLALQHSLKSLKGEEHYSFNLVLKTMTTVKLDITAEHCPMTFVKTKIQLSKLQSGDILEVLLMEGEPLQNVPKSAREQGFKVLDISHVEGQVHKVIIEK